MIFFCTQLKSSSSLRLKQNIIKSNTSKGENECYFLLGYLFNGVNIYEKIII